ncbi:hypothetical protein ABZ642_15260 [Streptomyces sp. NPDC007157]|uniref:hypothetical protein n=1 Tax=Streptomyces sp. NPDC007157 TaxID=3154681 RepID=UPI0033D96F78
MTREEVIALIRSLPRAEYEQIVDRELSVAEGSIRGLSPAELLAVRRQLVELPAT